MAKKIHRSAKGRVVDMDAMRLRNAGKVALGNGRRNAAGDIVAADGKVLVRRDQIIQDYYKNNPNATKQVNIKNLAPDSFQTPEQAVKALKKPALKADHAPAAATPTATKTTRKIVDPK